jgi:hypothetical protein
VPVDGRWLWLSAIPPLSGVADVSEPVLGGAGEGGADRGGQRIDRACSPAIAASTDWALSRWGQPAGSFSGPPACRRLLVDRLLHQPAPEPAPVLLPAGRGRHYQVIRSAPGGTSVPAARPPSSGDRRLRPAAPCAPAD